MLLQSNSSLLVDYVFATKPYQLFNSCFAGCVSALQVIAPEEIVDPNVDEHSVMTYLSQFPKAKLKPGAPLKSKQLFPNKVKAYGPGG